MLASGRPLKLRSYLLGVGIKLCVAHRHASLTNCPDCHQKPKKGREERG
jgi:hypothetical protein